MHQLIFSFVKNHAILVSPCLHIFKSVYQTSNTELLRVSSACNKPIINIAVNRCSKFPVFLRKELNRGAVKSMNKIGAVGNLCGTPTCTDSCALVVPSRRIAAFLSVKKERTQRIRFNGICCSQSCLLSLVSVTVSIAPLMSNANALRTSFSPMLFLYHALTLKPRQPPSAVQ